MVGIEPCRASRVRGKVVVALVGVVVDRIHHRPTALDRRFEETHALELVARHGAHHPDPREEDDGLQWGIDVSGQEQVGDDALPIVRSREADPLAAPECGRLVDCIDRRLERHRTGLEPLLERLSSHELEHEKPSTVGFLETMDRRDVGMIECSQQPSFIL